MSAKAASAADSAAASAASPRPCRSQRAAAIAASVAISAELVTDTAASDAHTPQVAGAKRKKSIAEESVGEEEDELATAAAAAASDTAGHPQKRARADTSHAKGARRSADEGPADASNALTKSQQAASTTARGVRPGGGQPTCLLSLEPKIGALAEEATIRRIIHDRRVANGEDPYLDFPPRAITPDELEAAVLELKRKREEKEKEEAEEAARTNQPSQQGSGAAASAAQRTEQGGGEDEEHAVVEAHEFEDEEDENSAIARSGKKDEKKKKLPVVSKEVKDAADVLLREAKQRHADKCVVVLKPYIISKHAGEAKPTASQLLSGVILASKEIEKYAALFDTDLICAGDETYAPGDSIFAFNTSSSWRMIDFAQERLQFDVQNLWRRGPQHRPAAVAHLLCITNSMRNYETWYTDSEDPSQANELMNTLSRVWKLALACAPEEIGLAAPVEGVDPRGAVRGVLHEFKQEIAQAEKYMLGHRITKFTWSW